MRFRGDDKQPLIIGLPDPDGPCRPDFQRVEKAGFLKAVALGIGIEQPPLGRCIDHPAQRHTVCDQGDINGEIATALDEFLCPVQRIDDDEGVGGLGVAVGLFLGHQHDVGKFRPQPGRDQGIGGLVRLGHRAVIRFGAHVEIIGLIDLHDPRASLDGRCAENPHQVIVIHFRLHFALIG